MDVRNKIFIGSVKGEPSFFPTACSPKGPQYVVMVDDKGKAHSYMLDNRRLEPLNCLAESEVKGYVKKGQWHEIGIVI